jgi:hypothetical protein
LIKSSAEKIPQKWLDVSAGSREGRDCKIYLIKRAKKIPRDRCPGKDFGTFLKNGNFSGKKEQFSGEGGTRRNEIILLN